MPLYICPEHWQVARKRLKWCLGYLATADKLGYTFQQMVTVPFLVLYAVVENWLTQPTEHNTKIMQLVMDTCVALLRDFQPTITTMAEYIARTDVRTKDAISNNTLYCAQLLALTRASDKYGAAETHSVTARRFCLALCEEELRRRCKELEDPEVFNLLGGPTVHQLYIQPYVEAFAKEQAQQALEQTRRMSSGLGLRIRRLLSEDAATTTVVNTMEGAKPAEADSLDPLNVLEQEYPLEKACSLRNFERAAGIFNHHCQPLMRFLGQLQLAPNVPLNLADLAPDPLQIIAMLLQNAEHIKNMVRSAALAEGKYVDFLSAADGAVLARQYLYARLRSIIKNMRAAECATVAARYAASSNVNRATLFARTDDIYEAAGALEGAMLGTNFMSFARALQEGPCPLAKEKIKMLLTGQFRGIKLIKDVSRDAVDGYIRWHPCKQNRNRLMRAANITLSEFDELRTP
jgi:hypothetical protein